jgi:hypothetical protein
MPFTAMEPGFEARHVHYSASADDDIRESLAYLLPLPHLGLGVIVYTWVHAAGLDGMGRAGAMAVVYGPGVPETVSESTDGVLVPDTADFDDWRVGPVSLRMDPAMTATRLAFAGGRIALEYEFSGINPSFAFLPHPGGCPSWLADDRAEQGGRVVGSLVLDGVRHEFDTFGHRDHSWGRRDWGGPTHWKWWNVMGPGTSIHCMELQYLGRTTLHGYVHRDGVTALLTDYDVDVDLDGQVMHTALDGSFTDEAGRVTRVRTWRGADLHWPVSPHLVLHEAAMHAEIEGVPGVAYIEMAWPPAYVAHHSAAPAMDASALTVDRPVELSEPVG